MTPPTRTPGPELVVAAGLLEGSGDLNDHLTVEVATERLRELLSPAALWVSGPLPPTQLAEQQRHWLGRVPSWRAPGRVMLDQLADIVLAAWDAALPPPRPSWGAPVLRLQVFDAEAAQQLAGLGTVGPYLIVPCIAGRRAHEFSWRWPLRIGVAEGPRRDQWRTELEGSPYAFLYDVRLLGPDGEEPVDIVFVDADAASIAHAATCVVVLGESTTPAERLALGCEESRAAIVIGAASADIGWFQGVVREMAHDQPIDVALRIASLASLIAADADLLQLTAVRQWTLALSEQLCEQSAEDVVLRGSSPEERLRSAGAEAVFDAEYGGATSVVKLVRTLEGQGYETSLRIRMATAMARPFGHTAKPSPPPVAAGPTRRLIADAWAGGRVRRKTLRPDTDHDLLVRIAVPGKGETAAQIDFPERELPSGASVELMVDVTSAALGLRARQPIVLSTADRSAPSTTALFRLHTQSEGTVVDVKILVTYQERPVQEAHYVATVRSRSVTGDRARLTAVALSSSPEPRDNATPAQLSLEVNGANLERTGSGRAVDLTQVRETLDAIERVASQVLASDDAPEKLADPPAVELLVSLARAGASLKKFLAPLQVGNATTVSLLVDATTPVLPLELAYDAATPEIGARLCEHRSGGTMVGKPEVCKEAGKAVVCPYAFWGQQRVIARTIRLNGARARHLEPAPLNLRPVLYAAAERADKDTPAGEKPSDMLESELAGIVGTSSVVRVSSWSEWKRKVRQMHPQLLVVLGHTVSTAGETLLEIGAESWLRDPDVDAEYLCGKDFPPPLVVLLACSSAVPRNCFGGLPAAFTGSGAAAVVATLTKLHGPHGARAAAAVVRAICGDGAPGSSNLGGAMTAARHQLIKEGLLVGLLLVSHGEIDLPLNS